MRRRREPISVTDLRRSEGESGIELSATVRGMPLSGTGGRRAWIRLSRSAAPAEDPLSDGASLLVALLPAAVVLDRPLRVEGEVPKRLLDGCRKAMALWGEWSRQLRPVPLEVGAATETRRPTRVGAFYSGGVDSAYSVLKSLHDPREPSVTDLVLIHGYDYDRRNHGLRELVTRRIGAVARGLDLGLVEVETNLRDLNDPFVPWGTLQCASLLGALGLAMTGTFGRILIAAGITYPLLLPWGSHPGLDPLWSTEATEIVHDGAEASRIEKVAWEVGRSDLMLENLRVCYLNPNGDYNCGRCTKCQRTLAALELAGALERCPAFNGMRAEPELIAGVDLTDEQMRDQVREFVTQLGARGDRPDLQAAFEKSLSRRSHRSLLHEPVSRLRILRNRHAPSLRL